MARRTKRLCPDTGKRRFRDHVQAVRALHAAANSRRSAALDGVQTVRRERRAYCCDACGGWHLTSWRMWASA